MHHRDELSDRAQELDDDLEVALKELHNLKTEKMRLQQVIYLTLSHTVVSRRAYTRPTIQARTFTIVS